MFISWAVVLGNKVWFCRGSAIARVLLTGYNCMDIMKKIAKEQVFLIAKEQGRTAYEAGDVCVK